VEGWKHLSVAIAAFLSYHSHTVFAWYSQGRGKEGIEYQKGKKWEKVEEEGRRWSSEGTHFVKYMMSHHLPLSSLLFSTVPLEEVTAKGEGPTGKVTWTKKKGNEKREENKEEKEKRKSGIRR
jgi:hypothetical protein